MFNRIVRTIIPPQTKRFFSAGTATSATTGRIINRTTSNLGPTRTAISIYREESGSKYVPPEQKKTITTKHSLIEAADIMINTGLGFGLLIVVEDGKVLGRVSERRIMRAVAEHKGDVRHLTVADYMVPVTGWVSPKTSLYDCMEIMAEKNIRHITILGEMDDEPVTLETMDKLWKPERKLQGVISIKKLMEASLKMAYEVDSFLSTIDDVNEGPGTR